MHEVKGFLKLILGVITMGLPTVVIWQCTPKFPCKEIVLCAVLAFTVLGGLLIATDALADKINEG